MQESEFVRIECVSLRIQKRPKTVIDHILKHGFITTEQLKDDYGYNHPPRAVSDVKEHGIEIGLVSCDARDTLQSPHGFGDPTNSDLVSKPDGPTFRAANSDSSFAPRVGLRDIFGSI